jgi:predicted metal-dependent hydrolase
MSAEAHTFCYGGGKIAFRLLRRDRATLAISVQPDLGVEVVAPKSALLEKIVAKVQKRAPWIQRQLRYFAQFLPRTPERSYISGETHLYLGRQYRLKVVPHIQQQVKLQRGRLVVQSCRPKQAELTRSLVEAWYRERAHAVFLRRIAVCQDRFADPEAFAPKSLIVRQLAQRWGSMTPKGNLVLNRALIQASADAIDYVITHELCHLPFPHHGPEFFRLLTRVMPDWEKRKLKLERQMA